MFAVVNVFRDPAILVWHDNDDTVYVSCGLYLDTHQCIFAPPNSRHISFCMLKQLGAGCSSHT